MDCDILSLAGICLMQQRFEDFADWIEEQSSADPYFAGTFWFVLSPLVESDLARVMELQASVIRSVPLADTVTKVAFTGRSGRRATAEFWHLPFHAHRLHLFFSLAKPWWALRFIYTLLGRAKGKAHLFPIGHRLLKSSVRLDSKYSFAQTHVVRGVSYPSRPSEGGAEINLKPGNAAAFFEKVEDERRVLKLARMRAPVSSSGCCEFTVSRVGYVSYHRGAFRPLLELITGGLSEEMTNMAKPFEDARGRFVGLRFSEPVFAERSSCVEVLSSLSRLPRTTVALLHANPYFHATLTNYEDGGEFDVFITNASTIHVQGRGEVSAASFLRLHNNLSQVFSEAAVALHDPPHFRLRDLLDGRV